MYLSGDEHNVSKSVRVLIKLNAVRVFSSHISDLVMCKSTDSSEQTQLKNVQLWP